MRSDDADVQKWYAITLGSIGDYQGEIVLFCFRVLCMGSHCKLLGVLSLKFGVLSILSSFDSGTQERILNGFKFKDHIQYAITLRPDDPTLHYLLGRWCYAVYMLSWSVALTSLHCSLAMFLSWPYCILTPLFLHPIVSVPY